MESEMTHPDISLKGIAATYNEEIADLRATTARQSAALAGARAALGSFVDYQDRNKNNLVPYDFDRARAAVRAIDEALK